MFDIVAAVVILGVSSVGPGFHVARLLRWPALDTVVATVGFSLIIVYVAAFLGFWLQWDWRFNAAVTLGAGVLTLIAAPEIGRLLARPRVRSLVMGLLGVQVATVTALLLIRHYSGGDSCCDWLEHFQRTEHFVVPKPLDFLYIDRYLLTARPPLQNVLAAHVLAQTGVSFAAYQVVFGLLNALMFLPCALMARLVSPRGFRHFGVLAVALTASPMFFLNSNYPWTKALTVFFVVLGLWCYLRGWRKAGRGYLPAAFLFLGAGALVHYSAVPYALVLGLHFLAVLIRRQAQAVRTLVVSITLPALLLLTWFSWSLAAYGADGTFLANSTSDGFAGRHWRDSLDTVAANVWGTLRPHLFDVAPGLSPLRVFTDRVFMVYQTNLFFGMGTGTSLVAVWLLARSRRAFPHALGTWPALLIFLASMIVVGVGAHGAKQTTGLAFIGLQPLIYTAIALTIARVDLLPRWSRVLLLVTIVVDAVLGIGFQIYMEGELAAWARTPNWDLKFDNGLVYVGDLAYPWQRPLRIAAVGGAALCLTAFGRFLLAPPRQARYRLPGVTAHE